jgi:hypothetical protein
MKGSKIREKMKIKSICNLLTILTVEPPRYKKRQFRMTRKLRCGEIPGISIWPITYRLLHASGASVTNFYLTTLQDDGNLPKAA